MDQRRSNREPLIMAKATFPITLPSVKVPLGRNIGSKSIPQHQSLGKPLPEFLAIKPKRHY